MLKDVFPFGCRGDLVSLTDEEFKALEKVARGDDEVVYRVYVAQTVNTEAKADADAKAEADKASKAKAEKEAADKSAADAKAAQEAKAKADAAKEPQNK
jgi:colicin import membrane protein